MVRHAGLEIVKVVPNVNIDGQTAYYLKRGRLVSGTVATFGFQSAHTQEVIKKYEKSFFVKVVIEPQGGLGRAHNRGWAESHGEIIAFTDYDRYPAEDFLDSVVRRFEADPRLGFVGANFLHDPEEYRITIQEKADRQNFCPGDFLPAASFKALILPVVGRPWSRQWLR